MTLAEMALFVGQKVRATDPDSLTVCKQFLARRYEMIWNDQLWKDAVVPFSFSLGPGAPFYNLPNRTDSLEAGYFFFPEMVDRVIAVRSAAGGITVSDEPEYYRADLDAYAQTGTPANFLILPRCVTLFSTAAALALRLAVDADAGSTLHVTYLDGLNERQNWSGALPSIDLVTVADSVLLVERVTKPTTTSVVVLYKGNDDDAVAAAYGLQAETSFRLCLPIRVLPAPTALTAFKALVKKRLAPFDNDSAVPELGGVDNCLIAFAQADMLERARQYGKAQLKAQEAGALLAQLIRMETLQQAHRQRVTPDVETVSGGDLDGGAGKGYW